MAFVVTNGLIAGMALAAFLALSDGLFHTDVFQTLIDLSYVPGLDGLPPWLELLIHLALSVVVTFAFFYLYPPRGGRLAVRYIAGWITAFTLLYAPFTWFSGVALSLAAFVLWTIGHVLYILFLTWQVEKHRR